MNSYEQIHSVLQNMVQESGLDISFSLDMPDNVTYGDYATNIAFALAKKEGVSGKECAEKVAPLLEASLSKVVEKVEVAGPGFINFFLKDDVRSDEAENYSHKENFEVQKDGKVIVEYTDPNPFKLFHIGHLVPNAIGESIACLYESQGKEVTRVCYQGDKGLHVAKTIEGLRDSGKTLQDIELLPLKDRMTLLGEAYKQGSNLFVGVAEKKIEITIINKKIYSEEDSEINKYYKDGKDWSLEYFETIYQKLGTKFDHFIMESEVGDAGKEIVKKYLGAVFEESEGALVYKGEKAGLHTRVFVNKEGLPTYEAKELGNTYKKRELVPEAEESIVVTGNEIDEYFKVIKAALGEIDKPLADSIKHISHGMLRLPEGKMSSRTGNVIPAEELIEDVKVRIKEKVSEIKKEVEMDDQLLNDIAVGAIKFAILKSAPGKDMIFDFEKSLSFEGDSGPYLQYTHARLSTLIEKARGLGITGADGYVVETSERELEQAIIKYSIVLQKAFEEIGPHHIVQYLLSLTRAFNSMYARTQIVDENNKDKSMYYVMLALATKNILAHGLTVLGIKAPERM
jgi:arginyl-tRNA synthetase